MRGCMTIACDAGCWWCGGNVHIYTDSSAECSDTWDIDHGTLPRIVYKGCENKILGCRTFSILIFCEIFVDL